MYVGSIGPIAFKVSSNFVRTYDEYSRDLQGRWAKHNIQDGLPKLEFLGPDLQQIKLTIILEASLGVNPARELKRLKKLAETGQAVPVVIGGQMLSHELWAITAVNETVERTNAFGMPISARATVTLQEYVRG